MYLCLLLSYLLFSAIYILSSLFILSGCSLPFCFLSFILLKMGAMKVFLEHCRGHAEVTPTPIETTTTTAETYAATVDQVPDVTEAITANSSAIAFPCRCCHKIFTTASNRKRHERTQHKPLLPFGPLSVTVISRSSTTSAYHPALKRRRRCWKCSGLRKGKLL